MSVNVPWVGPGGKPGDDVELSEEVADHLVGIGLGTEPIELRHDARKSALDIADCPLGIELALLLETALALGKFFAVEVGKGMQNGLTHGRASVGQEA